jgi:4-amino-4-deoxy-L-arabinose transferase-like glycosyltransferase
MMMGNPIMLLIVALFVALTLFRQQLPGVDKWVAENGLASDARWLWWVGVGLGVGIGAASRFALLGWVMAVAYGYVVWTARKPPAPPTS